MNHYHLQPAPAPVIREPRLIRPDGSEVIVTTRHGDWLNLTTGEFQIARIIDGRRRDTRNAVLVAGRGTGCDSLTVDRLYRVSRDAYFLLQFTWDRDWEFVSGPTIKPVDYLNVFACLRELIVPGDHFAFLRDWYLTEWLPYDFGDAARWAEATLSADEYERLFHACDPATLAPEEVEG